MHRPLHTEMHCPTLLVLLLVAAAAVAAPAGDKAAAALDKYTNKYDTVDVDQILRSERLLNNYFNCLMDRGPCTPEGTELKGVLPDALESGCSKCNEKQRAATEKVFKHLGDNKPALWRELQAKYDPSGKYRSKYDAVAHEKGVKV